ncbi:MAG: hypothetical protein HGA65_00530 [Oscillochloris sp.]|nr:hypothetical protein [Oscillochloris sp.]
MSQTLAQIESDIEQLSLSDQIDLMERLIRLVRQRAVRPLATEDELALMAQDPDIQREIATINSEFVPTEMDGLDATV